jgi:hypothetical protein
MYLLINDRKPSFIILTGGPLGKNDGALSGSFFISEGNR